jgi:hypothetical protein
MSLEHPSWCSRTECIDTAPNRRIHLSRPAAAASPCGELTVTVQMGQIGDDEDPVITMVAAFADCGPDSPAEEYPIRLDADLARAVGWMLLTTGRQAARHQNVDRHR